MFSDKLIRKTWKVSLHNDVIGKTRISRKSRKILKSLSLYIFYWPPLHRVGRDFPIILINEGKKEANKQNQIRLFNEIMFLIVLIKAESDQSHSDWHLQGNFGYLHTSGLPLDAQNVLQILSRYKIKIH